MENMEGDYFVVGTELIEGAKSPWKELQAGFHSNVDCLLKIMFLSNPNL